jgi:hypothetical protein
LYPAGYCCVLPCVPAYAGELSCVLTEIAIAQPTSRFLFFRTITGQRIHVCFLAFATQFVFRLDLLEISCNALEIPVGGADMSRKPSTVERGFE